MQDTTLGMLLADVKVGMRLKPVFGGNQAIVTELLPNGFIHSIPEDEDIINPHWSMKLGRLGHQSYVFNGKVLWEPA